MERTIIKNFFSKDKIGPFQKLNLIEAVIVGAILAVIILLIPFVPKVRVITLITQELIYVPLFIHGVKERSIGTLLVEEIKHKKNKNKNRYSFSEPSANLKVSSFKSVNSDESILEQLLKMAKEKINEYR